MRFADRRQLTSYGRLAGTGGIFATLPVEFSLELIGKSHISGGAWFKYDGNASFIGSQSPHLLGIRCPTGAASALQPSLLDFRTLRNGTDEGSSTQNFDVIITQGIRGRGWHHMYASTDLAAGTTKIWFDGVLVGQAARTFASPTFSSGAGALSYLGANGVGTASWQGFLRDFVVSFAPVTDDDVWDLYSQGQLPKEAYHWPCDDSVSSVLTCYKDGNRWPAFDATLVLSTNQFSRDVPNPVRAVDRNDNYVLLDGVNDLYIIPDEPVNALLQGAPIIASSGWGYMDRLVGGVVTVLSVPDSTGGSALRFNLNSAGRFQAVARSRDSGFAHVMEPASNHWSLGTVALRRWFHYVQEVDYAAKVHRVWIDGILAGVATGVAWEDPAFICTPAASSHVVIGSGSGMWPGKIGALQLFLPAKALSDAEAFDLCHKDQMPANAKTIIDFRTPTLVAPIDASPQRFAVSPVGIAAPYGPKHGKFGGIGR